MTHALTLSSETLSILNQRSLPIVAALAVQFAVSVTKWANRRRSRIALAKLDAHLLKDLGISEAQRDREAALPFWRA